MSIPLSLPPWRRRDRNLHARWGGHPVRWIVSVAGDHEIHALEVGDADESVFLLHGLSGSSRWWQRAVPGLAQRYRVVVPDLIGFGRSRRVGRLPSIATIAAVVADWMPGAGLETAHVVGHSMGGQVAIHLAARFPERVGRLVLADAAGIPRPTTPGKLIRFAAEIAPLWRWGDPTFLPVILADALAAGPRTLLQAIGHILQDDVRPLLPRIRAATLIVWGARDNWVPIEHAELLKEGIPDARVAVVPAAGHNPMVDRPAEFNRLVLDFLDEGADG